MRRGRCDVASHGWGVVVLSVCALMLSGCAQVPYEPPTMPSGARGKAAAVRPHLRGPLVSQVVGEPRVRVRLAADRGKVVIGAGGAIQVGPNGVSRRNGDKYFAPPVTVTRAGGRFIVTGGNGARVGWALRAIRLEPTVGTTLSFGGGRYPHALVLTARGGGDRRGRRFSVVNYLAMEQYLPGVLARELYGSWRLAAYRAQAIAARSYAIYQIGLHRKRSYDLEATVASQVYDGTTTNRRAQQATAATRGRVLVYRGRVVPAFYSSTCGGRGQDVTAAFPNVVDIAPLYARVHGDWCRNSPKFRWGPIYRQSSRLAKRLAGWGRAHKNAIGHLSSIASIRITRYSDSGRPAVFTVYGGDGEAYALPCEQFRSACNYATAKLGKVAKGQRLLSSDCTATVYGKVVRFSNGRGFGHGVGLCQWGAEGMAQAGYGARAILEYYYPGAKVQRVY